MTVGRRVGDVFRPGNGIGAGAVLDDHRLPDFRRQRGRQRARKDIGAAAGSMGMIFTGFEG